jgi:transposase
LKDQQRTLIWVGVDWATEEHQACVVDGKGAIIGERLVPHSGTGLAELCDWLAGLAAGEPTQAAVAIELPHGPVVETLLERGFQVFAINPKQLDRFRDRFTVAGAKDDRRDAYVLADSLRTDQHCFRALRVDSPLVIELREWSRMAEDLQQERVRLSNRVREQLRRYYPQMLELTDDVTLGWFLALWELLPTPEHARKARRAQVAGILDKNRAYRRDAQDVLSTLKARPLTVAEGTTAAATAHIRVLIARLRLVVTQLKEAQHRLDELSEALAESDPGQINEQRDVEILRSLPGVGRIVLATLLAEASQPLAVRDYHALRSLAGVAPVTRRSGKRCVVSMRYACHMRLRNALYHWSRVAVQRDPPSRAAYAELRARGHTHGRALRTVADRLLGVACAMLRTGTTYDPARRQAA